MATTAEGVFKILDQASGPIKAITDHAAAGTKVVEKLGKALDAIDAPKVTKSIKVTDKNVKGLGETVTKTTAKTKVGTDKMGRDFEKMSLRGKKSIEGLTMALKRFEHERATATVDVNIAKAEAKIRLLKQQLRTLTTTEAQKELGDLGLVTEQLTTSMVGGGSGGGGPGGLRAALGGVSGGIGMMAVAAIAAAPAIVALTGAASALVGSLGAAAGGAGALGIGTLGAFAVGLVAIIAIAKPAINQLKELKKAQDGYNKAVQQYGDKSAQAIKAQKALTIAQGKAPGAASVLQNAHVLGSRFKSQTGPARQDFFGILNEGLMLANRLLPTFSAVTNRALGAVRGAAHDLRLEFSRGEWMTIINTLGDTFARISGPAARSLGNIALWFGRIARAVSPLVVSGFEAFERWTGNLAKGVQNQSQVQQVISGMVDQLKSWIHLLGAAAKLAAAFFGAGATQGGSMVDRVTAQLNKWTDWVKDNPDKIQDFFRRTIDASGKLVTALGQIGKALGNIADAMIPILNAFSDLVSLTGGAGLLGPLALMGGAKYAAGKFGGKAAAGAAGAAGGGGVGGAAAAGGTAAAGIASRGVLGAMRGTYATARNTGFLVDAAGVATRGAGAGRLAAGAAALGTGAKFGLRAAGKFALPLTAALAAWDFSTKQGTLGERTQHALSGATFGLIPDSHTRVENRNAGSQNAATFMDRTGGVGGNAQVQHLQRLLAATTTVGGSQAGRGGAPVTAQMRVVPKLTGDARERVQAELDKLKPILHTQAVLRSRQKGAAAFDDVMSAFSTRFGAGTDKQAKGARRGLIDDLNHELKKLGPEGDRTLLHATAQWQTTLEHGTKAQQRIARRTREYIKDQYAKLGKDVEIVNGQILDGSKKQWDGIASALGSRAEKARQEVSKAFTDIQRQAIGSLVAMGYSRGEANKLVAGLEAGGAAGAAATSNIGTRGAARQGRNIAGGVNPQAANATGGRVPGIGTADSVTYNGSKVAPGELVLNQHTERKLDQQLGFAGATAMAVNNEHVPHGMRTNAATGARIGSGQQQATGGAKGIGGTTSAVSNLISQLDAMGFHHGSTTGGKHAKDSYHYKGMAVDYGNASNDMAKLWSVVYPMRKQFAELFGPSGMSPKPTLMHNGAGFTDPTLQAGHEDHIHMALLSGIGAIGNVAGLGGLGGSIRLKGGRSGLGGAPGALSTRARAVIAGAMQGRINSAIGGGANLGAGISGSNQTMGRAMMLQMGWGTDQWPALKALWSGESGWNEAARNATSGAYGIPQSLPASKMGPTAQGTGPTAAKAQINWGLNYIKGRYGSPSDAYSQWQSRNPHWYAMGGRMPDWGGWHAKGGSFTAHKPTVIGVGEGGAERVTISKLASSTTGGGRPVHVHIAHLHNHEPGDIADILEREFAKVAAALEHGPDDSEDELG